MSLPIYLKAFAKLHVDSTPNRWSSITKNKAPHKPLLLLAVIDRFAQKNITANLIELNAELADLFHIYWSKIFPFGQRGNIGLPFFHLKSDKFWHLILKSDQSVYQGKAQYRSMTQLREEFLGATLDEELYELLKNETDRNALRNVLIEAYFCHELQLVLQEQGMMNIQAFQYSLKLLTTSEIQVIKDASIVQQEYSQPVRSQGFRIALVKVYNHRCAFCGIRAISPLGHTVVDAAHIIPWSVSYNDHPKNGITLCKLCHWMFDEGLMSLSSKYIVLVSKELFKQQNLPGHLVTLDGRGFIPPENDDYLPDLESLSWHRQIRFCK